jgi:hypothetical protein
LEVSGLAGAGGVGTPEGRGFSCAVRQIAIPIRKLASEKNLFSMREIISSEDAACHPNRLGISA